MRAAATGAAQARDTSLVPLQSLATVIRSKNAGPFQYTVDVLFRDEESYEATKRSDVITRERVAALYRVPIDTVTGVYFWDSALALKVTLIRDYAAGSPGDNDCYGAQQHVPLLAITVPFPSRSA
jgi:hypothetical protein